MTHTADDARFMARALHLAKKGLYTTDPNPRVGCVVVNGGEIVGEGWHRRAGEPHAEINALTAAGKRARGATAYVSLEPCCHQGKTPPCTDALIAAGIGRVVAAMQDPNPQVSGRGFNQLIAAGVETQIGLMEKQAREINPGFTMRMQRGRPFVRVKTAASIDGRTALASGESKWITCEAARRDAQTWRARSSAILSGIGTVLADDPSLNVRSFGPQARQPLRVIVDSELRTPPTARLLSESGRTLIVAASDRADRAHALQAAGAELLSLPGKRSRIDLAGLMTALAERDVNELLVEAGATLCGALLEADLIDELVIYLAPRLMGNAANGMFAIPALARLDDSYTLDIRDARMIGADWRIVASVHSKTASPRGPVA